MRKAALRTVAKPPQKLGRVAKIDFMRMQLTMKTPARAGALFVLAVLAALSRVLLTGLLLAAALLSALARLLILLAWFLLTTLAALLLAALTGLLRLLTILVLITHERLLLLELE